MKGALFMSLIKLPFKIIAAPLVVALSLFGAIIHFLFCFASTILTFISGALGLLSIAMFVTGCMLNNCIWVMVFAFLLSPFGLQAVAEWLIAGVDSINTSLRYFIVS